MPRLEWDKTTEKIYETGTKYGVLYVQKNGAYPKGVAWNGLTGVTESPSGAEATALWADDQKYLNLLSAEEFGATITAYTYPDEFEACQGNAELIPGLTIGQQTHVPFGMCYRTIKGNDTEGNDHGYKLHVFYNATAAPAEKAYESVNDSPDAIEFSWEVTTTPVNVAGLKPTASLSIDSTKFSEAQMKAIEDVLYGAGENDARLPLPNEIAQIMTDAAEEAAG